MGKKFKSQEELFDIAKELKKSGKKIVTFNGSFDILHSGHAKSFAEAKSKGDYLIVFINSDKSVKSYKGPDRPIISENQRAEMVAALASVDYVAIFHESDPRKVLDVVKPDIHCNGAEWGKDCIERDVVEKNGGKVHILKQYKGISTTEIIKKILKIHNKK